ncbi:MAG: hypothetical protein NTU53_11590 [Planctomycetota bacterium]|nr:hypothetical protein [Planctomycetota bacterium]
MHVQCRTHRFIGFLTPAIGASSLFGVLPALLIFAGLAGCAPQALPATSHALTSADKVRILQDRPHKYEQLATITLEITPSMKWDERGDANPVFDLLKQKAAATGANAIVLWAQQDAYDILATAGYKGTFYQVPIKRQLPTRTAIVQAVYIVQE